METQVCKKCGRTLELNSTYFYKQPSNKTGFRLICKECEGYKFKLKAKEGYHICSSCNKEFPKNNEYFYIRKDNKIGFETVCKECRYKQKKQNPHKNKNRISIQRKEYIKKYMKKYMKEHAEYYREMNRRYKKKHRDKCNTICQRYRNKKRQLPSTLTVKQWRQIKQHFNNRCSYCGKELPLTQDHFIPLSKGGEYSKNNIIPSCKSCNSSKNNKDFFEWYLKYRYYSKKREKYILEYLGYRNDQQQISFIV